MAKKPARFKKSAIGKPPRSAKQEALLHARGIPHHSRTTGLLHEVGPPRGRRRRAKKGR